jgi:putative tryptophan/tyrosine transport system substrate-binding protein
MVVAFTPPVNHACRRRDGRADCGARAAGRADQARRRAVRFFREPSGNGRRFDITGFANKDESIEGKWLELLKEVAPRIARVDFIYFDAINPTVVRREIDTIETAARALGVKVTSTPFHEGAPLEHSIEAFAIEPNGGLIVNSNVITQRDSILRLAARHQLPLIAAVKSYPVGGGLMSYGTDLATLHREAASYVDRILRGGKPSDLPVQLPTKYDLVINLKTAKALSLTVPPNLLATADAVIE